MPSSKKIILITIVLLLMPIFSISPLAQQDQNNRRAQRQKPRIGDRLWTVEEAISRVKEAETRDQTTATEGIWYVLRKAGEVLKENYSEELASAIFNFPIEDTLLGEVKIYACRYSKDYPGVTNFIVQNLNSDIKNNRISAANVLVQWGIYDISFPVLQKENNFQIFNKINVPEAYTMLKETTKKGSWEGKINAAYALFYSLNDTSILIETALDVVKNASTKTNDKSNSRAQYLGMRIIARFNDDSLIPEIAKLAESESKLVRIESVGMLGNFKRKGSLEALKALEKIAAENPDPKIRQDALYQLNIKE